MKRIAAAFLLFVSACAYAQGAKPCEELKSEIAKKLEANGVKSYTLDIVSKAKETDGKVVGTCDAGANKIVYSKAAAVPKPEAKK